MFCMECGTRIEEGAKFCFNCGKSVPQMKDVEQNEGSIDKNNLVEEKYQSYFTFNPEEKSYQDIHAWCFRDYKDYVYFILLEYAATGKGKRRFYSSGDACCLGRIHKKSGRAQIMKTFTEYELGRFSIFDDALYLWSSDEYKEKYSVLEIDLQSNMNRVAAEFELEDELRGLEFVLKNKKGSFVYLSYGYGSAYIEQAGSADRKKVDGIEMWDGSILGYNENYLYYSTFRENIQYYCIELDTLNVHNLSDENEMVIAEREIDSIDCKRDILYLKNGDGSLAALDWQNNELWGVEVPDTTHLVSDGRYVRKWFNGKYWICLVLPSDKTPEGAFIGIVLCDEYGEILASSGRKFKGSPEGGQVLFAYDEIICAGTEVIGLDTKEYLMTSIPRGAYDRFYTLYYWNGEKLEAGKRMIREAFS